MTHTLLLTVLCCLFGISLLVDSGYAQDQLWSARLALNGRSDVPTSVAIDSAANVFVTGLTTDGQNTHDVTASYDILGVERWISENHPDSACSQEIIPKVLVLNGTGDPMIGGSVRCDAADKGFVQCLSGETGSALWRFRGPTQDSFWSPFGGLASDGAGGAYFVTDLDFGPWIIGATRLSGEGAPAWKTMVFYNFSIHATTAAATPGLLYIAGSMDGINIYVAALSSAGAELWERELTFAPGDDSERSTACATDLAGNLALLIDAPGGSPTGSDYEVLKFSPTGLILWHETYDGAGGEDVAAGITCGADGSVFVTGKSWGGTTTGYDIATVKFGPSGGPPEWVTRVSSAVFGADQGQAIELDSGSLFVTGGIYEGAARRLDAITLRYDLSGQEVWREVYSGPVSDDLGIDLAVSGGRIAVTGTSVGADGFGSDFFTVVYSQSPVAVPFPDPVPATSRLLVSPNPSPGACSFRFNARGGQRTEIRLHDLNGHLMRRLFDDATASGERRLDWDGKNESGRPVPNGVYFASIVHPGGSTTTQRITIVR
jgi:hypothetical protein